jgi:glycosyltransferase involved in cell wall biosynthesis
MNARYDSCSTSKDNLAMRIAYVITSLGMGGAERQVLALADRMAVRGHTVALLVLRPRLEQEWPTALSVVHLNMRKTPLSVLRGLPRGRRFLAEFNPDLVHSHSFHANAIARLLKILRPRTVILSTVHNVYEGGWMRMLAYRITDGLSRRTTAVSEAAADRFVRLKAISPRKCTVIPNAIDVSEFAPSSARRAATRKAMAATDEFVWLAVGRIVAAKDFPNLLRAFEKVRVAFPQTRLWIAGELPDRCVGSLDDNHAHGVDWLGLRRDTAALYDAADGFVLSSAWEGMPLAVAEAMAMEKPVVATDVGGVRELMGDAGVLVPPRDWDALAAAMVEMMRRSREDRQTLGYAARARIQARFSMDTRADEWDVFYHSVVEPRLADRP